MATNETTVYAAQDPARLNPSRLLDKDIVSGTLQFAVLTYATQNEGSTDVINLCILPAGIIPVPQLTKVTCVGIANPFHLDIGTQAASAGWCNELDIESEGELFVNTSNVAAWSTPTPLAADPNSGTTVIKATVNNTDGLGTGTLTFVLAYKLGR